MGSITSLRGGTGSTVGLQGGMGSTAVLQGGTGSTAAELNLDFSVQPPFFFTLTAK